jgi:NTP pyrophosphatase (non-canonical NTP hydrolase)
LTTNIAQLTNLIRIFCEERDWDQFHNPKDLAIGVTTEAAELLDLFRFKTEEDIITMMQDPVKRQAIGEELADVFYFLLRFSHLYDFNLSEELIQKMRKNELKYPVKDAKGSNKKYTERS